MNQNHLDINLEQPCDTALPMVIERLSRSNLYVVPTFNLQQTRESETSCTCPHHDTTQCDCQMIVLLVYGDEDQPASLILHGYDGRSWLSLVESIDSNTTKVETKIRKTLRPFESQPTEKQVS